MRYIIVIFSFVFIYCSLSANPTLQQDIHILQNILKDPYITQQHIEPIMGGTSQSRLYKINTENSLLCARFIADETAFKRESEAALLTDPYFICPAVNHIDAQSGLLLMDFIKADPPILTNETLKAIGKQIGKVHAIKSFSFKTNFMEWIQFFESAIEAQGKKIPLMTDEIQNWYKDYLGQIKNLMPIFENDFGLTHHDLHLGNVLIKNDQAYIVDWEIASYDCTYIDLAMFLNFALNDPKNAEKQEIFKRSYFGRAPTDIEQAKITVLQPLGHILANLILLKELSVPSWESVHKKLKFKSYDAINMHIANHRTTINWNEVLPMLALITFEEAYKKTKTTQFKQALMLLTQSMEVHKN